MHYTDTLPPAQAGRGYSEINDRGIVVGTTAPPKTPEDIQREEELKKLRDAADRAKKQQEAADRVLLQTFRSVDDMIMARDGRLASIDVLVQVTRSNIRRQQDLLRVCLRCARMRPTWSARASPSRSSQTTVSDKTELAIQDAYSDILDREQQKQEIYATFAADLKRFRQLKGLPEVASGKEDKGNMRPPQSRTVFQHECL